MSAGAGRNTGGFMDKTVVQSVMESIQSLDHI
jgi:hypothetical protein